MMKSFLLLILSLMTTGGGASSDVEGCRDGWVDFICKYPKNDNCQGDVVNVFKKGSQPIIQSTLKKMWQTKDRFSVYRDGENRNLRVVIRQLQQRDFGEYECKCDHKTESEDVELEVDVGCQTPFNQTGYRTVKTTMSCDKRNSTAMFFCKDVSDSGNNGPVCKDLFTKSKTKSNRSFTLLETSSSFTMSISNVSSQHAGVYWCGVKTNIGRNRAALRKIQLKVEETITNFTRSSPVGENLTYWCGYPKGTLLKKFICKGEDPSTCKQIVNTAQINQTAGKFSMMDDEVNNITIGVRDVVAEDSGTYWCGAERNDPRQSNPFFHRFIMTVEAPTTVNSSTVSTSTHPDPTSASSTQLTTASNSGVAPAPSGHGGSLAPGTIAVVVCVAVLGLLILVLVCKRFQRSKNTRNGEENNEDGAYEEIQERPQEPGSGTALNTIYVTANAPTMPSASTQHYSTVNFPNSSGEASGDTYSTVRDSGRSPPHPAVSHPSRLPEDPFYSTINSPQQH